MTFLCPIERDAWMDPDSDATCAIRANEDTVAGAVRLFFAAGV